MGVGEREGSSAAPVRITVWGAFAVTGDAGESLTPRGKKARALLAYLALARIRRVDRGFLTTLLWSDRDSERGRASLRQAIREAKASLDAGPSILCIDRESLALRVGAWVLDAADPSRGPLLADLDGCDDAWDEWLALERTAIQSSLMNELRTKLAALEAQGQFDGELTKAARALLSLDSSEESAHRALMRFHAHHGAIGAALQQQRLCVETLRDQFGVRPSSETLELGNTLRALHAPLAVEKSLAPSPRPLAKAASTRFMRPVVRIAVENETASPGREHTLLSSAIRGALARHSWLHVLAGPSSSERGLEDYAATIGIRRDAGRVQASFELVDSGRQRHLWSQVVTGSGPLIREPGLDVASRLAALVEARIRTEEARRARERFKETGIAELAPDALIHLAVGHVDLMSRDDIARAIELLDAALERDDHSARAHAYRAFCENFRIGQRFTTDRQGDRERALAHARRATELAPDDGFAWAVRGHIKSFLFREPRLASSFFERAIALLPEFAPVWAFSTLNRCYVGDSENAFAHGQRALALAPNDVVVRLAFANAAALAERYEPAAAVASGMLAEKPHFVAGYVPALVSLGHLGRHREARDCLAAAGANATRLSRDMLVEEFPLLQWAPNYARGLFRVEMRA